MLGGRKYLQYLVCKCVLLAAHLGPLIQYDALPATPALLIIEDALPHVNSSTKRSPLVLSVCVDSSISTGSRPPEQQNNTWVRSRVVCKAF